MFSEVIIYLLGIGEQEIIAFVVSESPSSIHLSLKQKLVSYAMPRVRRNGNVLLALAFH